MVRRLGWKDVPFRRYPYPRGPTTGSAHDSSRRAPQGQRLEAKQIQCRLVSRLTVRRHIAVLAEDLARNGQRVPSEVTSDGTIVDCERCWRAAKLLGWEELDVTVVHGLTDDDGEVSSAP